MASGVLDVPPMPPIDELHSVSAAARKTGHMRATLTQWILSGRLAAISIREGGRRRFLIPQSEIDALLASERTAA